MNLTSVACELRIQRLGENSTNALLRHLDTLPLIKKYMIAAVFFIMNDVVIFVSFLGYEEDIESGSCQHVKMGN